MSRPELLRYHPNHFSASRDFFPTLYGAYRRCRLLDGLVSVDDYRELLRILVSQHWNAHLGQLRVDERPRNTKRLCSEMDLFCHVARFFLHGRNIFHFSGELTRLLRLTDVDDVLWSSIKLPYSSFYLWLGPQEDWTLKDADHCIDGAYVGGTPSDDRSLDVLVTTRSQSRGDSLAWNYVMRHDVYYYFSFQVQGPGETVGETFRRVLETDGDFKEDRVRPSIPAEAYEQAARLGKRLERLPRGTTAQDEKVRERIQGLPVFREAIKLIVNSLCYLSSPSKEVSDRFPDSEITRTISAGRTPLERARARNRASREGYTQIHFCGDSLDRDHSATPTGKELSAHWRRGHWRNQAVGAARAEHKLIWIRPVLVRRDRAEFGVPGHVYRADGA
jgi:hypothetical protein